MAINTHTITAGENPWQFVKNELGKCTDSDVAKKLQALAEENGCSTPSEFGKEFFYPGKTIVCDSLRDQNQSQITSAPSSEKSGLFDKIIPSPAPMVIDGIRIPENDSAHDSYIDTFEFQNTPKIISQNMMEGVDDWNNIKEKQDEINNLPSDKERVIAYNREINKSRENYVIVDKKNYTATVYSWDGKVVKEFEVGVAKNKSDALLKRSYETKEGQFESTTAGIYTINYRANGHDAYSRTYKNRVFTLSHDGLRDRGVGNGETGVALHQIPAGNRTRRALLDREGVSDENNRFSSGCVNFREEDFDALAESITGVGTKVYILPEDENNYMVVKNGNLHFAQKEYTGDVPTTTTKTDSISDINIYSNEYTSGEAIAMMQTLSDKKSELAADLGLDNDTYNELALLTLGIAQQESEFGTSSAHTYRIKENNQWLVNTVKWAKNLFGKKTADVNSRGLTQMKLGCYTDKNVLNLLDKYGINENNLGEGENAAIATMIALASIYKNELPAIKEKMAEQDISVSDAILYCWQGKKSQIIKGTATPNQNLYIQNVYSYMNDFELTQYA